MIKFFRKIRHNLLLEDERSEVLPEQNQSKAFKERTAKREDRRGKYLKYAIGEIIFVVIGILIALQINNWNENRIESEREITYLSNSMTLTNQDLNEVDWIDALIMCFQLPLPQYNKNVWQGLKSTGDLSIIKDKTLTHKISYYYIYIDQTNDVEKEFIPTHLNYREITNEILDFDLKINW